MSLFTLRKKNRSCKNDKKRRLYDYDNKIDY